MTGATTFTRRAGLFGVVSYPLAVVMALAVLLAPDRGARHVVDYTGGRGAGAFAYLWVGFVLLCVVVVFAGLVVRHWEHDLQRLALTIGACGIVASLVFRSMALAMASVALTMLLVLVAVLLVGALPRAAVILMLAADALDQSGVEWDSLVRAVGLWWLAWAMWREPLPSPQRRAGSAPASPAPV